MKSVMFFVSVVLLTTQATSRDLISVPEIPLDSSNHAISDRELQFGICEAIAGSILGLIECTCALNIRSRSFEYDCEAATPICGPGTPLGQFCMTPSYGGSIGLSGGEITIEQAVCVEDIGLQGGLLGNRTIDEFCVEVEICPLDTGICSCSASFGPLSCESCQPCEDGTGVEVSCGVAPVLIPTCIPLGLPFVGRGFGLNRGVKPFVPDFQPIEEGV